MAYHIIMHITKYNNYNVEEKEKKDAPMKITCLFQLFLKLYEVGPPKARTYTYEKSSPSYELS